MKCIELDTHRLARAKKAFSTRRVIDQDATCLITEDYRPQPGDLVLAKVKSLGQHTGVQLRIGRRAQIYVGDEILVAYGSRYAPDQFEAWIPEDLSDCDLAAAGGLASRVVNAHSRMKKPTRLSIQGVLAREDGTPVNLRHYALSDAIGKPRVPVIAVVGTSMNAGKTTTAAALVRGLSAAGLRVGAAKVTGTGACGDFFTLHDAGSDVVWDFTDAGHATTYGLDADEVIKITQTLTSQIALKGCDIAVIEIADGVFQRETSAFLESAYARQNLVGLVFAAGDAAGAIAGAHWITQRGHQLLGISGVLTQSALQVREAATVTGAPVFDVKQLRRAETVMPLMQPAPAMLSRAS